MTRPLPFLLLLCFAGFLVGCSSSDAPRDILTDTSLMDAQSDNDSGDTLDAAQSKLSSLCPVGSPLDVTVPILPRPLEVTLWTASLVTLSGDLHVVGDEFWPDVPISELFTRLPYSRKESGDLSLVFHSPEDAAELEAVCEMDIPDESGFYLATMERDGGWELHLFATDSDGAFRGFKTAKQLLGRFEPTLIGEAQILSKATHRLVGVTEGFYGKPWGDEARIDMMRELADVGFNLFVYAPKAEAMINAAWMQPYSDSDLTYLSDLHKAATSQGIRVCWQLHTGLAVTFSDPQHYAWMLDKFRSVGNLGYDCLVLAFDDINKLQTGPDKLAYTDYTNGQIDFANRLAEDLSTEFPGVMLGFVPIEYFTHHEDAATDLARLGAELDPRWVIAWTGPDVISTTVADSDITDISNLLGGREVFFGDNYPVNDAVQDGARLHLGPITGRDATAATATYAVSFNAMSESYASLPALATAADWATRPDIYDPAVSVETAAALYASPTASWAFGTFLATNRSKQMLGSEDPDTEAIIHDFETAVESGEEIESTGLSLAIWFANLVEAGTFDETDIYPPLLEEILPWLKEAALVGEAGVLAVKARSPLDELTQEDTNRLNELVTEFTTSLEIVSSESVLDWIGAMGEAQRQNP